MVVAPQGGIAGLGGWGLRSSWGVSGGWGTRSQGKRHIGIESSLISLFPFPFFKKYAFIYLLIYVYFCEYLSLTTCFPFFGYQLFFWPEFLPSSSPWWNSGGTTSFNGWLDMLNMLSSVCTISFEGFVPYPETLIKGQQ